MTGVGQSGAVTIEGAASAVIRVPHPWYLHGPNTIADLTLVELGLPVEAPRDRPRVVAIVHERADNPGVSITNAAEAVFEHVHNVVGRCYVVEHYDAASYQHGRRLPETFDLVTLDDRGVATWRHLGADVIEVVGELVIEAMRP